MNARLFAASATIALAGITVLSGCGADAAPAASPVTANSATSTPAAPASSPVSAEGDEVGTAFTAFGAKSEWRAVVAKGVLTTEGAFPGEREVKVTSDAFAKGVEFTGTDAGEEIALVVRGGDCLDADGKNTGQQATLTVGKKSVSGCAVSGALLRNAT